MPYARRHRVLRSSPITTISPLSATHALSAAMSLSSSPEETSRADMARRMLKRAHGLGARDAQKQCDDGNDLVTLTGRVEVHCTFCVMLTRSNHIRQPAIVYRAKGRTNISRTDAEQRKLCRRSTFTSRSPLTAGVEVPNIDDVEHGMDIDAPGNDPSFQTPHPTLLAATQAFKLGTSKPRPLTPGRAFSPVPKVAVPKRGSVERGKQKKVAMFSISCHLI